MSLNRQDAEALVNLAEFFLRKTNCGLKVCEAIVYLRIFKTWPELTKTCPMLWKECQGM